MDKARAASVHHTLNSVGTWQHWMCSSGRETNASIIGQK